MVRRIAGECTDVNERDAVDIRLEPAAAIDENQDGTRGSNLIASAANQQQTVPGLGFDYPLPLPEISPDASVTDRSLMIITARSRVARTLSIQQAVFLTMPVDSV